MSRTRVAVVAGVRTPFAKRGTAFGRTSALELGAAAVRELVARAGVPAREIERVVFGQVVPSLNALNVAREIVLETGLAPETDAYSVARACATGYQATIDVAQAILAGDIACGIAGGTDSASDVPIALSKNLGAAFIEQRGARSLLARVRPFTRLAPRDFVPEPPALTERTTGLTMGEHAERMAQENGISRPAQDEYAHRSHCLAAAAWADGRFAEEVITVATPEPVSSDNLVRRRADVTAYARLAPVFDPATGTITAGNSSALSDGASALLLLREDRARALGLTPLAYLRAHAFTALDPNGQLLMGPAYAIPKALARAGLTLADLDLLDLHEAFAATGGRQIVQTARELRRRGGRLACVAACAAGGLGAAIVLEAE